MANNKNEPKADFTGNSLILAVFVAVCTYLIVQEAPLQGLRPAVPELPLHENVGRQDVGARLWQDPFSAVARSIGRPDRVEVEQSCKRNLEDRHCRSPLTELDENQLKSTRVIGVTVSGAPYAESVELRRRLRYAVLAGLHRADFAPEDSQHIGYFRPEQTDGLELPTRIPFEWFRSQYQRILVLWLNEDILAENPLRKLSRLVCVLRENIKARDPATVTMRIIGPEYSDTLLSMANEAQKVQAEAEPPCPHATGQPEGPLRETVIKVAMSEASEKGELAHKGERWNGLSFYVWGATVEDREILSQTWAPDYSSAHDYFDAHGVKLYRTIATDDVVARAVAKELQLRGVTPGKGEGDHVALIYELDTFYGKKFPSTMEQCFADVDRCRPSKVDEGPWVKLAYLRGLDGALPASEASEDQKASEAAGSSAGQSDILDAGKTPMNAKTLDQPFGQRQYDYLRRIAKKLKKKDEDLRREGAGSIKAIGVLGTDVFDKLLVLRALRPYFPEALFFTTDFDAALMMRGELGWTRNLIISSSFGPELAHKLHGDIPPFRSGYQTAAFLATQLAIGNDVVDQDRISHWLSHARVFEIGRTGNVIELPGSAGGLKPEDCAELAASCSGIQPPEEKLFPELATTVTTQLASALALAALIMLLLLFIPRVRRTALLELLFLSLALLMAAWIIYCWEPVGLWLTQGERGRDSSGEPIAFLQGVSVWPTILLRIMSILLSLYLILRAQRELSANLGDIVHKMKLPPGRTRLPLLRNMKRVIRGPRRRTAMDALGSIFARIFSYRLNKSAQKGPLDVPEAYDIARVWREYVQQNRFFPRFCRVVAYVAAVMLLGFVLARICGFPVTFARSSLPRNLYSLVTFGDVIFSQFLIFFVFDATLFCLLFMNELRRGLTQWPPETTRIFEESLGLEHRMGHELVAEWIDLDFLARRTTCISSLIYYPFIVIALLILCRSTIFANYPPSTVIVIMQGLSLGIAVVFAVWLRWAAEAARDVVKWKLMAGIVRAKGLEDGGRTAGQLETLLSCVDGLHQGAFSPFSQQPLVRALLLPLGSLGWIKLLESGVLPSL